MQRELAQVALVTGASSGIGLATALLLAERGYRTFGTSQKAAPGTGPKGVEMVTLDVTSDESARAAVADIADRAGHISVLVNNAGFGLFGAVEETTLEEARSQVETNFWGAVRMTTHVLPAMRERRAGRIINISSMLGLMAVPFHAFYVAAKHALEGYSEALSLEVKPFGVHVVLVEPSYIRTPLFEHRQEAKPLDVYKVERQRVLSLMRERIHNGSHPDVVARVVLEAVTAKDPAVRYGAGFGGGVLKVGRALLPTGIFDRMVRRAFALD